MAKISVVTISFNQAQYLQECINSVVNQHIAVDLQYIVVDPGSTDTSRALIESNSSDIDCIIYEPDDGPADGLNHGFSAADGDVYCYINADDRFVPGALQFVSDYFDSNPDVDVLCGAIRIINEKGAPSKRKRTSDNFDLANYISGICTVGQQATFFRRVAFEKAGGFNPDNHITWDGELLVDMALSGCKFTTVSRVLGDFRVYPESITGSKKFLDKQYNEFERIKHKLDNYDVKLHGRLEKKIRRILYKLNIFRHIKYLLVR